MSYNISTRMLKKVLSVQSKSTTSNYFSKSSKEPTDKDLEMRRYIKSVLSSENINHFEDKYGNIYAVKGKAKLYDCIVSHIDTVHDINLNTEIRREGDFLYGFDPVLVKQVGTGGKSLPPYIEIYSKNWAKSVKATTSWWRLRSSGYEKEHTYIF